MGQDSTLTKSLFVKDITADTPKFQDVFLVQEFSRREKKTGGSYFSMKLRDKTGDIDSKVWDASDAQPAAGRFIKVEATTSTYKDAVQLTITRWRLLEDSEVDLADFIPTSEYDRDEMLRNVQDIVVFLRSELRSFVTAVLDDDRIQGALRDVPAASKNHQCYLGGLLEHITQLVRLAKAVSAFYPKLDQDLLVAAAIIHDLGKVQELEYSRSISYSRPGRLIGHIPLGLMILSTHQHLLEPETRDHLFHIVTSHHGRLEWGSPKTPMTREAFVFHQLDMIDARLGTMDIIEATETRDAQGFTGYSAPMGGPVYFPPTKPLQEDPYELDS